MIRWEPCSLKPVLIQLLVWKMTVLVATTTIIMEMTALVATTTIITMEMTALAAMAIITIQKAWAIITCQRMQRAAVKPREEKEHVHIPSF